MNDNRTTRAIVYGPVHSNLAPLLAKIAAECGVCISVKSKIVSGKAVYMIDVSGSGIDDFKREVRRQIIGITN